MEDISACAGIGYLAHRGVRPPGGQEMSCTMVRLMLAATLRKYIPDYDSGSGYETVVEPASTVRDLCRQLGIPEKEVKLIMIEGIAAGWDTALTGNERVALFPPIGGG